MKKLEIFDPALCCSTGVCGPSPDARLTAFASVVSNLKNSVEVNRYNLAQEPGAFAGNPVVKQVLQEEGPKALPVILIDGKLVMKGIYPTGDQLAQLLGFQAEDDCCGESTRCCCDGDAQDDCCGGDMEDGCGGHSGENECCCANDEDGCCANDESETCCSSEKPKTASNDCCGGSSCC